MPTKDSLDTIKTALWIVLMLAFALGAAWLGNQYQQRIFLVRSYVSTNLVEAGYFGSSTPRNIGVSNGWIIGPTAMNADYVAHPPVYRVVTNYVLGYRDGFKVIEVMTATK